MRKCEEGNKTTKKNSLGNVICGCYEKKQVKNNEMSKAAKVFWHFYFLCLQRCARIHLVYRSCRGVVSERVVTRA